MRDLNVEQLQDRFCQLMELRNRLALMGMNDAVGYVDNAMLAIGDLVDFYLEQHGPHHEA